MKSRAVFTLLACLTLAISASGEVSDMALDRSGTLYQVTSSSGSLVLTVSPPKSDAIVMTAPGVLADEIINPLVTVDELSQTVVMVWQKNLGDSLRCVELAIYRDGTWFGPFEIAGDGVSWATNPTLLVHQAEAIDEEGNEIAASFIHVGYWEVGNNEDGGHATVTSIPFENGVPLFDEKITVVLRDLVPYGIACDIGTDSSLSRPRFFLNTKTRTAHMLFVDIVDCRFVISRHELIVPAEVDPIEKRRRCISSWRTISARTIKPQIARSASKFNVGHNMSVVMYWDEESAVAYATLIPDEGWSDIKLLELNEHLDHEQAVELIRQLANMK